MTNPINLIKEGIQTCDWDLVCQGYNAITDSDMLAPESKENDTTNHSQLIQEAIELLQNGLNNIEPAIIDEPKPKTKVASKPIKKSKAAAKVKKGPKGKKLDLKAVAPEIEKVAESLGTTAIVDLKKVKLLKGEISLKDRSPSFPANKFVDQQLVEANAELAKQVMKESRPTFTPDIVKCECGAKVDAIKNHMGTYHDSDGNKRKIKCPECKNSFLTR